MFKLKRIGAYFIAFILFIIAVILGGKVNYALIKYLGGQYGIMTEFYSDWADIAFHRFTNFRNAALILAFLAILVLVHLHKHNKITNKTLYISFLLYSIGCVISAFIFAMPVQLLSFIIRIACCFAIYIIAVYIVLISKKC